MTDFLATPGNDVFNGSVAENDTVSYEGALSAVSVSLSIGFAQTTGGSGTDTLISIENLIGTRFNDTLTGNIGNNIIAGGDGNDTLIGGDGDDTLSGDEGDDTLNGGRGNNVIDGGSGIDTATLDFSDRTANVVLVNGAAPGVTYTATAGGVAAGSIKDVELVNITGGSGNDRLGTVLTSSAASTQSFTGGTGIDTFVLDATAVAGVAFAGRIDRNQFLSVNTGNGNVAGPTITFSEFENIEFTGNASGSVFFQFFGTVTGVTTGAGNDILTGLESNDTFTAGDGNDIITGNGGNDTLNGGRGNNVIDGGSGIDTATLDFSDRTANVVLVNGAAPGITYTATVGGVAAGSIKDVELLNITGGSGNDRLGAVLTSSAASTQSFTGGTGIDTFVLDATAVAGVAFAGGIDRNQFQSVNTGNGNVAGPTITFSGFENIEFTGNASGSVFFQFFGTVTGVTTGAGNDILTGLESNDTFTAGDGNDIITGNGGNDTLNGGRGNNVIDGGSGIDTATLDFSDRTANVVLVNGAAPGVTYTATVGGVAAGSIRDVELLNITGGSGNDRLGVVLTSGAATTQSFSGGTGIDTFVLDATAVAGVAFAGRIDRNQFQSVNTGNGNVAGPTITFSEFENIEFTGNASGSVFFQGIGTVTGVTTGAGNDILTGLESNDTFTAGDGNDILTGNGGNDTLNGGRGNNVIDGGSGIDTATLDFSDRTANVVLVNGAAAGVTYTATVGGVAAGSVKDVELLNITGGSGNDRLGAVLTSSAASTQSFTGGTGIDTFVLDATAVAGVAFAGGMDRNQLQSVNTGNGNAAGPTITFSGFENIEFTGNASGSVFFQFFGTVTGVTTGAGNDLLTGLESNDTFTAGDGNDILTGNGGNDALNGGRGNNVIDGGSGIDTATLDFSDRTANVVLVNGAAPGVTYIATVGGVVAGSIRDVELLNITGGSGDDRLGTVVSAIGSYSFNGNGGVDTLVIDTSAMPDRVFAGSINVNQLRGADATSGAVGPTITFSSFENIEFTGDASGSAFFQFFGNVTGITSGIGNDILVGLGRNDTFNAGEGNDTLTGNGGNDTLNGGAGADVARFSGQRDDYTVTVSSDGRTITVRDNRENSPDGTDTLTDVEFLDFADRSLTPNPPIGPNSPPIRIGAQSILGDGFEDTGYTVTTRQLTQGFADPNNDALFVSAITATNGSVSAVGNGNFRLNPNPNYNGPVSFSYTLSDGRGGTIQANLDLTLRPVNDAPVLTGPTGVLTQGRENVPYTIAGDILLAGYADPEGDAFALATISTNVGTVTTGAGGNYTLTTPFGFSGPVQISYQLADSFGATTTVSRTIDIRPENLAPLRSGALAALPNGSEDQTYTVTAQSLLQGYTDPDGDALSVVGLTANRGTVVTNGDGTFTITPNANYNGTVSLSYAVSDGEKSIAATNSFILDNEVRIAITTPSRLAPGETGIAKLEFFEFQPFERPSLVLVTGRGALIEDPLTGRFAETVWLLQGVQNPSATSETTDLNVKMASSQVGVTVTASTIDPDAVIDWPAFDAAVRPDGMSDAAWDRASPLLRTAIGNTYGDLAEELAANGNRIASFGMDGSSVSSALRFEVQQATDFGTFQARETVGSLGEGWAFIGDTKLTVAGDSVTFSGLLSIGALSNPGLNALASYTLSASVDRAIDLGGGVTSVARTSLTFVKQVDGRYVSDDSSLTLTETSSGYAINDAIGNTLAFNANGRLLTITTPLGQVTTALYDTAGRMIALEGPQGNELQFMRSASGNVTSIVDGLGNTATLAYDADGRLESVTSVTGTRQFDYAGNGDLTSVAVTGVPDLTVSYDGFGRLAKIEVDAGSSESYTYDGAGGYTQTDANGAATKFELLQDGGVGRITDATGQSSGRVFDTQGNLIGIRGADGSVTQVTLDEQGRVTSTTDGAGAILQYTYEGESTLPATFTDANGSTRSFTYNAAGQTTEARWVDGTSLKFAYDGNGNIIEATNRSGVTTIYSYDGDGKLVSASQTSAGAATYSYDPQGRLTAIVNDQGTTALQYDSADRITKIDFAGGRSLAYTYDGAGNRTSMTDQDGNATLYTYDSAGRLASVHNQDGIGTSYSYDAAGYLVKETNSNGTTTDYDYDAAGNVMLIVNKAPDGIINSEFHYSYNAAGQRSDAVTSNGTWTYGYDGSGQLISANFASINPAIPNKTLAWVYDAAGNRLTSTEDGVTSQYTTNSLNQYTTIGNASFTYDDSGNMTSKTDAAGTAQYGYDLSNRLISVTTAAGSVTTYEYDAFGNRSTENHNGVRTEYLVDPFDLGNVVAEFNANGSRIAFYLNGLNLAGKVSADGAASFFDLDATASVVGLTGANGSGINTYAYLPFGGSLLEQEAVDNRFEFNGGVGVLEDENGLSYMRARTYDQSIGRFITEDRLFTGSESSNYYRFGLNDPVNRFDPSGYLSLSTIVGTPNQIGILTGVTGVSKAANSKYGTYDAFIDYVADSAFGRQLVGLPTLSQSQYDSLTIVRDAAFIGAGFALAPQAVLPIVDALAAGGSAGVLALNFGVLQFEVASLALDFVDLAKLAQRLIELAREIRESEGIGRIQPETGSAANSDGPQIVAQTRGDPHLVTFDGLGYGFQAVGEFTLIRGADFEIQVRQTASGPSVSVNTAVALRMGDDTVAVYAGRADALLINGKTYALAVGDTIVVGDGSVFRRAADTYEVIDGDGNGFATRITGSFMNVFTFLGADSAGAVSGLLGNADGNGANDLVLADGTVLTGPVGAQVLYGAFADTWRVSDATSLFTYAPGETTETFTDRSFPAEVITLADLPADTRAAAEAIAIAAGLVPGTWEFETTVLDVALTGNSDFADAATETPALVTQPIMIVVQRAPVANDDVASTIEDTPLTIDVLNNDSDPEDDDLLIVSASDPAGGSVVVTEDGKLLFTPKADFNGTTTLSYRITDSFGNFSLGRVTVDIAAVNDAPVAGADAASVDEGAGTVNLVPLLLSNDDDADDGDLSQIISVSTSSTVGRVVFDFATQSLRYFADADVQLALRQGQSATDSFTYTIADAAGLTSTATVTVTVNGLDNDAVYGTPGPDVLNGSALGLQLVGGLGDDRYVIVSLADRAIEAENQGTDTVETALSAYALGENLEGLRFTGLGGFAGTGNALANFIIGAAGNDTLSGLEGDDVLRGNGGNDLLFGREGDDVLSGGTGQDTIDGGTGFDLVSYTGLENAVTANLSTGFTQKIRGGGTETLTGVEGIIGTAFNDSLTGDKENNRLEGADGNDTIVGGRGNDTLLGGEGDDVFRYTTGDGQDTINGGAGFDTIRAVANGARLSFASITDIELITAAGFSNVNLFGTAGNDTIDLTSVTLDGIGFIDAGNGNDIVIGSAGNDIIRAGNGADVLTGGDGDDRFVFQRVSDGLSASFDVITDFVQGSDIIDLAGVDANSTTNGNQAFSFIGSAAFSGTAGELRVLRAQGSGITRLQGDTNGDGVADFFVQLTGLYVLTTGDLVL